MKRILLVGTGKVCTQRAHHAHKLAKAKLEESRAGEYTKKSYFPCCVLGGTAEGYV